MKLFQNTFVRVHIKTHNYILNTLFITDFQMAIHLYTIAFIFYCHQISAKR